MNSAQNTPTIPRDSRTGTYQDDFGDAVTMALAEALAGATAAGRWDVVAQLAKELEARRLAHVGGNVVRLTERKGTP